MTPALTLEELLAWSVEASNFWKAHLDANPALLPLPCDIGGASNVREFVRHIWGAELRMAQRITGQPVITPEDAPDNSLDPFFDLHLKAVEIIARPHRRSRIQLGRDLQPRSRFDSA